MALSYLALVVVNNSGFETENMWIIYTPMFIGVYVFSRWLDSRIGRSTTAAQEQEADGSQTNGFGQ